MALAVHVVLVSEADFTFISLNFIMIVNYFSSAEIVKEIES
jgi:hypothetical protein